MRIFAMCIRPNRSCVAKYKALSAERLQSSSSSPSIDSVSQLSAMDDSRVMEVMDSLWFFGNVVGFSSTSSISLLGSADCGESMATTPFKHVEEVITEKGSKPMSPILQNQQKYSPPVAGKSVPIIREWEDDEAESLQLGAPLVTCSCLCGTNKGQQVLGSTRLMECLKVDMGVAEYYSPSPRSAEKGKRRKRRKRSVQRNKRKIFGELDLSFENVKGNYEENFGFDQRFGEDEDQMNRITMPSIRDDMAMKEHLKSWAHAVACTVR